jgi:hypothetical protein
MLLERGLFMGRILWGMLRSDPKVYGGKIKARSSFD